MKSLYLQNNKLVKIDKLPQLPSLIFLWLDDNNITTINKEAFRNCFLLTDIRLDHNQIEDIDKETFKDLSDLASIYLHNNKFKQQQDDEKRLELYFEKKLYEVFKILTNGCMNPNVRRSFDLHSTAPLKYNSTIIKFL